MKPDFEDPNNHVPEITPEDDWADVGEGSYTTGSHLPPRRAQGDLPTGRDLKVLKVRIKGDLESSEDEDLVEVLETAEDDFFRVDRKDISEGEGESEVPQKPKRVRNSAVKQQPASKETGEPKAKGRRGGSRKKLVDDKFDGESEKAFEEDAKIVLPVREGARGGVRVNTIGEEQEAHAPQPSFHSEKNKVEARLAEDSNKGLMRKRKRSLRGQSDIWEEKKPTSTYRWLLYSGVAILALVVLAVALNQGVREKDKGNEISFFSKLEPSEGIDEVDDVEAVNLRKFEENHAKAREIYGAFLGLKSPLELKGLIYDADRIFPLAEKDWKPVQVRENWIPSDKSNWSLIESGSSQYAILSGVGPDFDQFECYFRLEESGMRLDWKATTGYGSATFEELREGKGDASEIRAIVSKADFFTYALPENRYRSYRLVSPDGEITVWGYTNIGSKVEERMSRLFEPREITGDVRSVNRLTMTLSRGVEASLANQWIIDEIKSESWID
jgi:hypothetical protein